LIAAYRVEKKSDSATAPSRSADAIAATKRGASLWFYGENDQSITRRRQHHIQPCCESMVFSSGATKAMKTANTSRTLPRDARPAAGAAGVLAADATAAAAEPGAAAAAVVAAVEAAGFFCGILPVPAPL
jgi:hypothetical protein